MPIRRANPKKWLAIAMIALGVIIVVALLGIGRSGYYPHGMYGPGMYGMYGAGGYGNGMYGRPYRHHYGGSMMGNGPMWDGWMGSYGMPYPGAMMFDGKLTPGPGMMPGLELTQDQQTQIDAIESRAAGNRQKLLESLRVENSTLNSMMFDDSDDARALTEQYERSAQIRRQIFELGVDERQKLDAVLSNEQRQQWRQWQRVYMMQ